MAEIEIEKKKPIWPWILGLLLLAAIIYFVGFASDDDGTDDADDLVEETQPIDTEDDDESYDLSGIASISAYTAFLSDPEMGLGHEYSHGALTRLIDATRDIADETEVDINADLSAADELADETTTDPYEVNHADKIKKAAVILSKALSKIQQQRFPDLQDQVESVEAAANGIEPSVETLEQKERVKSFFDAAAELLTSMN